MTKIYLIRHAEAEGNLYRIAHGQYNSTITPRGYRQLSALKRRFADIPLDAVYGSDLFRTQTTASAVYKPKNLPFHPLPLLREVRLGCWEQRSWAEIERMDREMLINFNKFPDLWQVEGAETFDVVRDRMLAGIRQIAAEQPGRTVAAASHGAASRILLGTLMGLSLREIGAMHHCDNTAVSLLEVEGEEIRVIYQGDNSHLNGDLSTFKRQTWHKSDLATEPGLWYQVEREDDTHRVQRAYLEQEPVGLVAVQCEAEGLRITDYHIDPAQRGRRYGAQLMGQAVQYAREKGLEQVVLTCAAELAGYFEQFGFVQGREMDGRCEMTMDIRLVMREIV